MFVRSVLRIAFSALSVLTEGLYQMRCRACSALLCFAVRLLEYSGWVRVQSDSAASWGMQTKTQVPILDLDVDLD
jgi:hypothetical protein